MKKINLKKFFELCISKDSFLYLGKKATCLYSEPDECYFIAQYEDDGWESIYEDQIEEVFMLNGHEFLIRADNGEESVVTL